MCQQESTPVGCVLLAYMATTGGWVSQVQVLGGYTYPPPLDIPSQTWNLTVQGPLLVTSGGHY